MQYPLKNLTDFRKYRDGPAVINVRFVLILEECCYFACQISEEKKKKDNKHEVILTIIA